MKSTNKWYVAADELLSEYRHNVEQLDDATVIVARALKKIRNDELEKCIRRTVTLCRDLGFRQETAERFEMNMRSKCDERNNK